MINLLAAEGGYQAFHLSGADKTWLYICLVAGIVGIGAGLLLARNVLSFDQVRWAKDAADPHPVHGKHHPETAHYVCPRCGARSGVRRWDRALSGEHAAEVAGDAIAALIYTCRVTEKDASAVPSLCLHYRH